MNARVGPALFPTIQICLRYGQALEAQPFQRRLLRVSNARLHFALAIRILNAERGTTFPDYSAVPSANTVPDTQNAWIVGQKLYRGRETGVEAVMAGPTLPNDRSQGVLNLLFVSRGSRAPSHAQGTGRLLSGDHNGDDASN